MVTIRKILTAEQSNLIKNLIVQWVCGDIHPTSIIDDEGLQAFIQECVKLGMHRVSIKYLLNLLFRKYLW